MEKIRIGVIGAGSMGRDGGYTHTSKVVAIHSVQPGDIRFETRNTHYRLLLTPLEQTADCPPLGMAA